jgi:hypothetical protein
MWSIQMVDWHSAMKRNEAVIHTTIWMSPEDTMLRERGHTQKGRTGPCLGTHTCNPSYSGDEENLGLRTAKAKC